MTVLVGVMGATSISIGQDPQPAQSGQILFETVEGLYVTDAGGLQSKQVLKGRVAAAALSLHGDLVAYANQRALRVVSLLNGQSLTLASLREKRIGGVAWSPNQRVVAYEVQGDLFLAAYPPGSQPPRNLGPWYETISFSPDGKLILHPATVPGKPLNHVLETVDVETGKRQVLFEAPELRSIVAAHYSPDGSHIAFTMSHPPPPAPPTDEPECGGPELRLWVLAVGSKTPGEINLSRVQQQWTNVRDFAWSPDGKRLTVGIGTNDCGYLSSPSGVFVTSLDQTVQFKLSRDQRSFGAIFSPDGKKAVFTEYSDGGMHPQLMICDLATRKLTPVANTRSADGLAVMSRSPVPTAVPVRGWNVALFLHGQWVAGPSD
jgi:WD40 repeat protein